MVPLVVFNSRESVLDLLNLSETGTSSYLLLALYNQLHPGKANTEEGIDGGDDDGSDDVRGWRPFASTKRLIIASVSIKSSFIQKIRRG